VLGPVGQLIDTLDTQIDLDEDDLVTDAFVIVKVIKTDGTVTIATGRSQSLDWLTALAMVTAAQTIENSGYSRDSDN
jgi:hypothetical protein